MQTYNRNGWEGGEEIVEESYFFPTVDHHAAEAVETLSLIASVLTGS